MENNPIQEKRHIIRIDILRGIAILCVFLFHTQQVLFPDHQTKETVKNSLSTGSHLKSIVLDLLPTAYGWTGVELFLLVSGFVIHFGFLSGNQKLKLSVFYSKRFWRIYPPYLIALLFFCFSGAGLSYYFSNYEGIKNLLTHLFFVHNLFDRYYYSINGVFWSLALEMQLYLIYPLFLFIRKKYGIDKTIVIILLILPVSYTASFFLMRGSSLAQPNFVLNYWWIWCLGALLAEKYFYGKGLFKKHKGAIATVGFVLIILAGFYVSLALSALISVVAWLAFFEWILYASINTKTYLSKTMATIGLCSYSIYLLHQPYLPRMLSWFNGIAPNAYFAFLKAIPVFIVVFIISWLYYKFIEMPSISLGYYVRKRVARYKDGKQRKAPPKT